MTKMCFRCWAERCEVHATKTQEETGLRYCPACMRLSAGHERDMPRKFKPDETGRVFWTLPGLLPSRLIEESGIMLTWETPAGALWASLGPPEEGHPSDPLEILALGEVEG